MMMMLMLSRASPLVSLYNCIIYGGWGSFLSVYLHCAAFFVYDFEDVGVDR
jgi:hypothetical protein